MLNEIWIRWEPTEGLSKKYSLDSILDNIDNFEIILEDVEDTEKKNKIKNET